MKIVDIFEANKIKERPKKTLWFQEKQLWFQDIQHRFSDVLLYKGDNDIIALNNDKEKCYGKWMGTKGVTYAYPRPIYNVIHPRTKLTKVEHKNES